MGYGYATARHAAGGDANGWRCEQYSCALCLCAACSQSLTVAVQAGVAGQQFPRPVLPPGVGAHACHPWLRQCLLPVLYWAGCSPHVD